MRSRQRSVPNRTGSGSSSSSSPERILDDDRDIMMINDDSQTSIGDLTGFRDMTVSPSQKQTQPLSPVYRLPPEILMSVFNKISSPADLRSCMLVSKQWASCSVELLWHRPYLAEFRKYELMVKTLMAEAGFFMYPQLIRRLNLNFIADKISDGSMVPLVRCTRLERLTLTNCSRLTDRYLVEILENNQRIQALDLSQLESITDKSMQTVADNCPRLQGLNIAGCKLITDASLIPLSENRRMLRRVINYTQPR